MKNIYKFLIITSIFIMLFLFLNNKIDTFQDIINSLSPITGSEPVFNSHKWNSNPNIRKSHNCYSYVNDDIVTIYISSCTYT